ncbi:MAG: threonine dehydratase [Gemmatimonadales bacterium]
MISLAEIESAAELVYSCFPPTPQYAWPLLAEACGCTVWVKHENDTPIGAFKVRGGLVYMEALRREHPEVRGVITATRGNHGQSVGYAARKYGVRATIVVPRENSVEKNAAMRALGVELVEVGHDFSAAYEEAVRLAAARGLHLMRSFHPLLVRGVATYGLELFRAVPALDTVYVPIGLGSGICGVIAARNALGLDTTIVGVVAERADAYARSFEQRELRHTSTADTFADGLAVRNPDPEALAVMYHGVSRIVRVSEADMRHAIQLYFTATHQVAEGAGAAALAALIREKALQQGKQVGVVLSGANIDRDLYRRILAD